MTVISTATDTVIARRHARIRSPTPASRRPATRCARIPPGATFNFATGAYPNQLNNIGIHGNFAFVPNTGASPNGPVRFDVNTQSLLPVIDRDHELDAGQTINMHLAVAHQTNPAKLFITVAVGDRLQARAPTRATW